MKIPTLSELRKTHERESGRLPLRTRLGIFALVAYFFWIVLGFFVVPPVLRTQLQKRLSEHLQRGVTVEKVKFNPFTLGLTLEDFAIAGRGSEPFLGWSKLYLNFEILSFVNRQWRFQEIELDGFTARIAQANDGRFNFADILERFPKSPESVKTPKKSWPFHIGRLSVTGAKLDYEDRSHREPFATRIGPTNFVLRNFRTGGPDQAPGEFTATTESGESLSWRGAVALDPIRSSGELEVGQLALRKYAPYYADAVRFDVLDGRLTLNLHYDFSFENGKPALRVSDGKAVLKGCKIAKRGQTVPAVAFDQVELTDVVATWPAMSLEAGRIGFSGGAIKAVCETSGLDLVTLFTPEGSDTTPVAVFAPSGSAQAQPPPKVKISAIAFRGTSLLIEDHATPRIASHRFADVSCDLRNFSLATTAAPMPFGFRAQLAPEGEVHMAGTLGLNPIKAELGVELTNVALADFSPYLESLAKVRIGRGKLNTALYFGAVLAPGQTPALSAQGDLAVDDFAILDGEGNEEIAGWRNLSVKGFEYAAAPEKWVATEVVWTEPVLHLIVSASDAANVPGSPQRPAANPPQVTMPKYANDIPSDRIVSIDRFAIDKASLDFTDRSLKPNVHLTFNQLNGVIEGLSSSDLARATVDLRGRLEGVTPVAVTGKMNPLSNDAFADLKFTMKSMDLALVGPYLSKYAGYELGKGNLTLDVKCRISRRKLECTNVATLDDFTLGAPTQSTSALKLPVKLLVALLRDASGRIVLDPVLSGSVDDPEVRTGRIVWRVIGNALTKLAASPFAYLASLADSNSGEELSFQKFGPGENFPLGENETKKLDVVARALQERPSLKLEIAGGFDPVIDAAPLREKVLLDQMRNMVWIDRRESDPSITVEQIEIDPQQQRGMIRRLFYKAFPNEKPRRRGGSSDDDSGEPVSGQRGDLGAFHQKKASTVAHEVPRTPPPQVPETPKPEDTTETTATITEVRPPTLDEMKARLLARIAVDDEVLRKLASDRANAVRDYLVNNGQLDPERVILPAATADRRPVKGARVELRLK